VIDPGHGGKDPGAIGRRGLREKHVVLEIAKALHQIIRQRLPEYRVIMTRERDRFVSLGKRAHIANKHRARVFISIHANASPNRTARGIETWYLSFAANERAKRIAARENNMSTGGLSELERILLDLRETERINQSAILAGITQTELVKRAKAHYQHLPSRGVEGAPFIVLLNTSMPSILVEVAFVSNKYDERLLRRRSYQRTLAEGIFRGIHKYLANTMVRAE
jgi:N-acetylmuramoyl-L-alanine amidase